MSGITHTSSLADLAGRINSDPGMISIVDFTGPFLLIRVRSTPDSIIHLRLGTDTENLYVIWQSTGRERRIIRLSLADIGCMDVRMIDQDPASSPRWYILEGEAE